MAEEQEQDWFRLPEDLELAEKLSLPPALRCKDVWTDGCDTPVEPFEWHCPNLHQNNAPSEDCPQEVIRAWVTLDSRLAATAVGCPPDVLRMLALDVEESIRLLVARHPHTPSDVLLTLANDSSLSLVAVAMGHRNAPTEMVDMICERYYDDAGRLAIMLKYSRHISSRHLVTLSRHPDAGVRRTVAQHRRCPPNVIDILSRDPDEKTRLAAQLAHELDGQSLSVIATSSSSDDRRRVAEYRSCPIDLLRQLASDDSPWVRHGVASNIQCTPDIVMQLVADESLVVRRQALEHPNLPEEYRLLRRIS